MVRNLNDNFFVYILGSDVIKSGENDPLSDSDEAPDDVPFSKAKIEALSVQRAQELVKKTTKEKQKKQRQKNEALMREQKEEKLKRLQSLASKRLPEDLVDNISAQPIQPSQNSKKKLKVEQEVSRVHTSIQLKTSFYENSLIIIFFQGFEHEHYIPLETEDVTSQDFSVAILESKKWKNKFSKPGFSAPKNFRQQMLYSRTIKRETSKCYLIIFFFVQVSN